MAKDTLLNIIQDILSDADGDEVAAYDETVESEQLARIIRNEFLDIVDNYDLEHHKTISRLTATSDSTPAQMTRPEGFYDIEWIKYDKRLTSGGAPEYKTINYLSANEFIELSVNLRESDSNTVAMAVNSHSLNIRNDKHPTYWTFIDGYDNIIFDSWLDSLDTTCLVAAKSLAYGKQRPTLALADATVPDLPQNQMQLLKNRSRAMFFDLFKDGTTKEVDKRMRNSEVRAQRMRHIAGKARRNNQRRTPDYGRK